MLNIDDLKKWILEFDNSDKQPIFCLETLTFQCRSYYSTNTRGIIYPKTVIDISKINDADWTVSEDTLKIIQQLSKLEEMFIELLEAYTTEEGFYKRCRTQWDLANKMRLFLCDKGLDSAEAYALYLLMGTMSISTNYFNVYNVFNDYLEKTDKSVVITRAGNIIHIGDFKYEYKYSIGKCNEET